MIKFMTVTLTQDSFCGQGKGHGYLLYLTKLLTNLDSPTAIDALCFFVLNCRGVK